MSTRGRFWSPWLGLAAVWGCLNPQPDTGPLRTGPAAPDVAIELSPPNETPTGTSPGSSSGEGLDPDSRPSAQQPMGMIQDAGVPPADAAPPNPVTPAVSTFSTRDAGALDPDAEVTPDPVGDGAQ